MSSRYSENLSHNRLDTRQTVDASDISVVIPTYNSETSIRAAIESVLNQTCKVGEIVVVDDGSTDNTKRELQDYIISQQIKYIFQNNAGVSKARNTGITNSIGQWIAFLDSDDKWLPNKIQEQLNILNENDIPWCCGCITVTDDANQKTSSSFSNKKIINIFDGYSKGLSFQTGAFIIRKDILVNSGLFKEHIKIGEDRDLWWRIGLANPMIGYVPSPVVYYNINSGNSITRSTVDRNDSVTILIDFLNKLDANPHTIPNQATKYFNDLALSYIARTLSNEISVDAANIKALQDISMFDFKDALFLHTLKAFPTTLRRKIVNFYFRTAK